MAVSRFLDDAARTAFERAIATIERASAVEAVVAVRRRSAAYLHANVIVGGAAAVVGLVPGVKRLLTPAALRQREVARAARATFVERGLHNTRDRSGVLVYISWLEREVILVADSCVERRLPAVARMNAEQALTAAMANGGAAVARELEALAAALGSAMPRRADDVNELPDAIDSDLDQRSRGRPRR